MTPKQQEKAVADITRLAEAADKAAYEAQAAAESVHAKSPKGQLDIMSAAELERCAGIAYRNAVRINELMKQLTQIA